MIILLLNWLEKIKENPLLSGANHGIWCNNPKPIG